MKIKYFIRGAGIGILFAALVLFITGKMEKPVVTDQEIISRARELGMVSKDEVEEMKMDASLDKIKNEIETITQVPSPVASDKKKETVKKSQVPSVTEKPSVTAESSIKKETESNLSDKSKQKIVTVKIKEGMVSSSIAKYFYQVGVVGSSDDFKNYLGKHNYAHKIRAGEYDIPVNSTYEEIIDMITLK